MCNQTHEAGGGCLVRGGRRAKRGEYVEFHIRMPRYVELAIPDFSAYRV
jgi:hypothetical protein